MRVSIWAACSGFSITSDSVNSSLSEPRHLGMVPTRQRLEAGYRAVVEPHDRLVEDGDFLALKRTAQIGLERQAVGLARPHRGLEHLHAIAADALGVIHRKLGIFQHL